MSVTDSSARTPVQEVAEAMASSEASDDSAPKPALPNGHQSTECATEGDALGNASEVARFGAIKEKKHSLEAGMALFN